MGKNKLSWDLGVWCFVFGICFLPSYLSFHYTSLKKKKRHGTFSRVLLRGEKRRPDTRFENKTVFQISS